MKKVTVQVKFKDHESIVLTRGNGDTYTSKPSELIDFFHSNDVESPVPDKVDEDIYIRCKKCNGQGWTAEHNPMCDGSCTMCPVQVQCEECYATGYVKVDKWQAQQSDAVEEVLAKAVSVIKQWHNADEVWELYYINAPEMKPIRDYYQSKQ